MCAHVCVCVCLSLSLSLSLSLCLSRPFALARAAGVEEPQPLRLAPAQRKHGPHRPFGASNCWRISAHCWGSTVDAKIVTKDSLQNKFCKQSFLATITEILCMWLLKYHKSIAKEINCFGYCVVLSTRMVAISRWLTLASCSSCCTSIEHAVQHHSFGVEDSAVDVGTFTPTAQSDARDVATSNRKAGNTAQMSAAEDCLVEVSDIFLFRGIRGGGEGWGCLWGGVGGK